MPRGDIDRTNSGPHGLDSTLHDVHSVSHTIEHLLEEAAGQVDEDVTRFIRTYLTSLRSDLEWAIQDGEDRQLELITSDLRELLDSTCTRLGVSRPAGAFALAS